MPQGAKGDRKATEKRQKSDTGNGGWLSLELAPSWKGITSDAHLSVSILTMNALLLEEMRVSQFLAAKSPCPEGSALTSMFRKLKHTIPSSF